MSALGPDVVTGNETVPDSAIGAAQSAAIGQGPWRTAWRRLRHKRSAVLSLGVLTVIAAASVAAPLYAHDVAHTNPFVSNLNGTTIVSGRREPVLQQGSGLGVTPIGPTWDVSHYFLGADNAGRDVAARVLYGGRASLLIAITAALASAGIATILGLIAGALGGLTDTILSRLMDLVWSFPVYLVAIALSAVLLTQNLHLGPISISSGSLLIPIAIIGLIFIPYFYRPVRGQALAVRERDFVKAAVAQGASTPWLMRSEILPNVAPSVVVLLPLIIAINLLVESGLSFLGIGVQPPQASWGSIIGDGQGLLYTRPWVAIAPGLMIAVVVLALNVLGDGVRDAMDPRSKLKLGD
jgi:peptide/nickel transport system permease protein